MTFFAAPTPGSAFRPVSSTPLITPFRRIVATIVATAIAAPRMGMERDTRRESRAPPQRASRLVMVMAEESARRIPDGLVSSFQFAVASLEYAIVPCRLISSELKVPT